MTKEWNGEGLPPVGCECEYKNYGADDAWERCEILAHRGDSIIFWSHKGFADNYEAPSSFRPIKSKQEIDRQNNINELITLMGNTPLNAWHKNLAEAIIDAGYRNNGEEVGAVAIRDELVNNSSVSNCTIAELLCDKFRIYPRSKW